MMSEKFSAENEATPRHNKMKTLTIQKFMVSVQKRFIVHTLALFPVSFLFFSLSGRNQWSTPFFNLMSNKKYNYWIEIQIYRNKKLK